MNETLHSTYWYRVARLKPVLRDTVRIARHVYRGRTWFILRNLVNSRNHRFNASAYRLIGLMDGKLSVDEIWLRECQAQGDNAPTQDEVISLLSQLYDADLILHDSAPDLVDTIARAQDHEQKLKRQRVTNPFFIKIPLWDPDRFLERWSFLVAPLLSRTMLFFWLILVFCAGVFAVMHAPELGRQMTSLLTSPAQILLLLLIYPLIKLLHEFGHAFAVKKWGGEVHEMGIVLLALMPIPYVEASSSGFFAEKHQRVTVAAMGMAVELMMASLALLFWINVEEGLIRTLLGLVIMVGGVSTILFNGNPLLRFDGYYILTDLIEIPNLSKRSNRYLGYLFQRYLFGIRSVTSPVTAPGEAGWFLVYGPLAFIYRLVIFATLVFWFSGRFLGVGMAIATWGLISLMVLPAGRALAGLFSSKGGLKDQGRVLTIFSSLTVALVVLLFVLPMPLRSTAQGVIWLPEESAVRSAVDMELTEVFAVQDSMVYPGTLLLRGESHLINTEIELVSAQLREAYAEYHQQTLIDRVKRNLIQDDIDRLQAELQQLRSEQEKLQILSSATGILAFQDEQRLAGRFVRQGELLGYVVAEHRPTIRTVIHQHDINLVRERTYGVEVRLNSQPDKTLAASIHRIVPAAGMQLPTPALGTAGGGRIPVDPSDPDRVRAQAAFFQLDLVLPESVSAPHIGSRVFVKFDHGSMTLARQAYRGLRQLFLRHFYV
jgi:putative peptide zinc metalloprotease protein